MPFLVFIDHTKLFYSLPNVPPKKHKIKTKHKLLLLKSFLCEPGVSGVLSPAGAGAAVTESRMTDDEVLGRQESLCEAATSGGREDKTCSSCFLPGSLSSRLVLVCRRNDTCNTHHSFLNFFFWLTVPVNFFIFSPFHICVF